MKNAEQIYTLYLIEMGADSWCVGHTDLGVWLGERGHYIEWDTSDALKGHVYSQGVNWEGTIKAVMQLAL